MALVLLTSGEQVNASDYKLEHVWETVCAETRLDPDVIGATVQTFAKVKGVGLQEAPLPMIQLASPGGVKGWALGTQSNAFMVVYGEREANGRTSRSCTVSEMKSSLEGVKEFIETRYETQLIGSEPSGSSDVYMYKIDLIGFSGDAYVTIQHALGGQGDPAMNMTAVSLFDMK
jgi:hypothetical protein